MTGIIRKVLSKWKPVSAFMRVGKLKEEALDWTNEVTQRGGIYSSSIVPPDLRNTKGRSILTKSGKLVAGVTLFRDWNKGSDAGIRTLFLGLIFALMISYNLIHTIAGSSHADMSSFYFTTGLTSIIFVIAYAFTMSPTIFELVFIIAMFTVVIAAMTISSNSLLGSVLAYAAPALVIWGMNRLADNRRAKLLRFQASHHMDTLGEAHVEHNQTENPLVVQVNNAIKDTSSFIELGTATGTFQTNGDINAPEAGNKFGLTLADLARHLFKFGKSGAGKSWSLRSILGQIYAAMKQQSEEFGLLVLDGKGDLPLEVEPLLDVIVHPTRIKNLNVIEGISPDKWRKTITDMNGASRIVGDNAIFAVSAGDLIYFTALIHDALVAMKVDGVKYNLSTRYQLMTKILERGNYTQDGTFISHPVIDILVKHPNYANSSLLKDAVNYVTVMQSSDRQKLTQSVLAQAQSWLSSFFQQAEMRAWADSETTDFVLADVCYGLKVGVALPPEKFGVAGQIVTQLIKSRIFNLTANRESNWRDTDKKATSIILMIDECQDLVTDEDVDNAPKARSRGLILIYATQSITNLHEKFGNKDKSYKLLLSFSSIGAFNTDDKETNSYMQEMLGSVRFVSSTIPSGAAIDFGHTNKVFLRSPEFDSQHPEAKFMKNSSGQGIIGSANEVLGIKYQTGIGGAFVRDTNSQFNEFATYSVDQNQPVRPLFSDLDVKRLEVPQHAVFRVMRAGLPRADIIKVKGISVKELANQVGGSK